MVRGHDLRQPGNDSWLIADEKAKIPGGLEIAARICRCVRDGDKSGWGFLRLFRSARWSDFALRTLNPKRRRPPWDRRLLRAQKRHVSAVLAGGEDEVEISLHAPEGRVGGNQTGTTSA